MRLLAWALSFIFPLCGTAGSDGVPAPGVVDFQHIAPPAGRSALVAPAGFMPAPDFVAESFAVPPAKLFGDLQAVAAAQARTYPLDSEPQALQSAYVVRSAAANFPDVVEIAVVEPKPGVSSYIFYSRALYGEGDYGVNLARAKSWAAALHEMEGR